MDSGVGESEVWNLDSGLVYDCVLRDGAAVGRSVGPSSRVAIEVDVNGP